MSDPQFIKTPSELEDHPSSHINWIEGDRITFTTNDLSEVLDQVR
jgi:hypothetical protein